MCLTCLSKDVSRRCELFESALAAAKAVRSSESVFVTINNKTKEYEKLTPVFKIAKGTRAKSYSHSNIKDMSQGEAVFAARIGSSLIDLRTPLKENCTLDFVTASKDPVVTQHVCHFNEIFTPRADLLALCRASSWGGH
jgi:hypothetical protein